MASPISPEEDQIDELGRPIKRPEFAEGPIPQVPLTPQQEAYLGAVKDMPVPQRPGVLSRIAAGLAGFSEGGRHGGAAGVQAASDVLQEPYKRNMEAWKARIAALEPVARMSEEARRTGIEAGGLEVRRGAAQATAQYQQGRLGEEQRRTEMQQTEAEENRKQRKAENDALNAHRKELEKIARQKGDQASAVAEANKRYQEAMVKIRQGELGVKQQAETRRARTVKPMTPSDKGRQAALNTIQLRQTHPEYAQFVEEVKTTQGMQLHIKNSDAIPQDQYTQNLYKEFISRVYQGTEELGTIEEVPEDDEEEEQ